MATPALPKAEGIRVVPPPPDGLNSLFGSGTSTYGVDKRSFILSYCINILVTVIVLYSSWYITTHTQEIKQQIASTIVEISPYVLPESSKDSGGGGGGGDRDKLVASKGALPKQSREQFTPPMVIRRNDNPKLEVDPTVVVPPISMANMPNLGDPLSKVVGLASNGTGSGGGIGSGSGGGVGSGRGPGVGPGWGGGIGGGPYRVGGGVSAPRILYSPDPEYSEEARKAKYQGTVVLWVVIGPDGRPRDVRVQRSLGLGLDEKAIEAVKTWKFDPARKDGQPVAVQINVEVNFRLY
jgi:periplasmic protein TonB